MQVKHGLGVERERERPYVAAVLKTTRVHSFPAQPPTNTVRSRNPHTPASSTDSIMATRSIPLRLLTYRQDGRPTRTAAADSSITTHRLVKYSGTYRITPSMPENS